MFSFSFSGLGGYDHGLYVEKWAPFVKVSVIQFNIALEICVLPSEIFNSSMCCVNIELFSGAQWRL